ncbi:MAG TPA: response regulator transcription factor [Cytophagaceae bacterium]|jgi:DNA-binding NarL/FixJ family response regulator|nr:response regulator transcription factor [Cytophagaceae bacterium]
MINIYLISDQEVLKESIKSWLRTESEIRLTGAVNKNLQSIRNLKEMETDIIAVDIEKDDGIGQDVIRNIKEKNDVNKILVLYPAGMENNLIEIYQGGTKGFLMKDTGKDDFILALKKLYRDKKFICAELAMQMLQAIKEKNTLPVQALPNASVDISKREMEVLKLISDGFTNHEIADKLFTSRRTVETHRKNLIQKTETKNTAHLIKYAVYNGIIK